MENVRNNFSIILPVRNGGEYIKECVYSILNQTYSNFNLLILDNNSCDGTTQWLLEMRDSRISIFRSDKDLTINENWQRALSLKKNKYITLIGHDDILFPNYLEEINNLIKQHPDASIFHTHFNLINEKSNIIRKSIEMPITLQDFQFLERVLKFEIDTIGTGYVIKSDDYNKLNGIDINYPNLLYADIDLWLRAVQQSYIAISPKTCFAFRIHQSTTKTSTNNTNLKAFEQLCQLLLRLKENENLNKTIEANYNYFFTKSTQGILFRLLKTEPKNRSKDETFKLFINRIENCIEILNFKNINLKKNHKIKIAFFIYKFKIINKFYLILKKLYKKPIFK